MLMLSQLLRFRIVDHQQHFARPADFAIDLDASIYPPVIDIIWNNPGRVPFRLHWAQVQQVDESRRRIEVQDLDESQPVEPEWLEKAVLLKRDILDAIMLDLQGRTPVLANDVLLEKQDGALLFKAVDIGFLAILRRLSGGRFHAVRKSAFRDWIYIEFLRGNPAAAHSDLEYHGLINRLPAGEIAYLADFLPYLYAAELLAYLPEPLAADSLEMMMPDLQIQAFEELEPAKAGRILALMRPDIAADLISRLENGKARGYLEQISREQFERVIKLLGYPEGTTGSFMTNDMITLPRETTASEAMTTLMNTLKLPNYNNFIQFLYVVDSRQNQRLLGALTFRDLLIADPDARLDEIMAPYAIALHPFSLSMEAARRVIESGMSALPVIGQDGEILGVVTVDSALALTVPKSGGREVLRLFT